MKIQITVKRQVKCRVIFRGYVDIENMNIQRAVKRQIIFGGYENMKIQNIAKRQAKCQVMF